MSSLKETSAPLRELVPNKIWCRTGVVDFYSVQLPVRMFVIRLDAGGLLLYSPIKLYPAVRKEIDALDDDVVALLAPNVMHHLFIRDYQLAYPNAKTFFAPNIAARRSDLKCDKIIIEDGAEPEWQDDLKHFVTQSGSLMEEVLLYHAASETLICADFIENFSAGFSRQVDGHEALKFGMSLFLDTTAGRACCSPEHSIYATDLELFRGTVRKLAALPFRSLFVCHGDLILGDERDALTREGEATAATPETREAVVDVEGNDATNEVSGEAAGDSADVFLLKPGAAMSAKEAFEFATNLVIFKLEKRWSLTKKVLKKVGDASLSSSAVPSN